MKIIAPVTFALLATAQAVSAQTAPEPAPTPVVTLVNVPMPWYAPPALIVSKMRATVQQYEKLPGLAFKMYSLTQEGRQFGGIYHWQGRATAEAWFSAAWFERVQKERGVAGQVTYFEAPVTVSNQAPAALGSSDSSTVATLVLLPAQAGVTRQRLAEEFRAAVPTYQKVPGLLVKHFVIDADGRFGGIYLWKDKASAEQWFSAAWRQRARQTYGAEPAMAWFDTPILTPSVLVENRLAAAKPATAHP
ncbi:MAG TPA: hypothetical protein VE934_09125 [Polaromonas sp.]|uniref:hypothetical protein n=1 Tax=Polaromonas sp. TaxID=1869339 RepID=UPI002D2CA7E4|nr:hypothetical protein [Polaromonas sp.]HYW57111.1 hypothetical protein [Polaromonas sp.]